MSRPSVFVAERFLSKFDQTKDDDCWLWKSAVFENGYGQFWDGTKTSGGNKDWAGERSPKAKLTEKKVIAIRKRYATGKYTYRELACRYGVGEHQIGHIVRRQSWSHVA